VSTCEADRSLRPNGKNHTRLSWLNVVTWRARSFALFTAFHNRKNSWNAGVNYDAQICWQSNIQVTMTYADWKIPSTICERTYLLRLTPFIKRSQYLFSPLKKAYLKVLFIHRNLFMALHFAQRDERRLNSIVLESQKHSCAVAPPAPVSGRGQNEHRQHIGLCASLI